MLSGKNQDASAVQQAIADARAREQRLDSLLGPPPRPPTVPKVALISGRFKNAIVPKKDLREQASRQHVYVGKDQAGCFRAYICMGQSEAARRW